MAVTVLLGKGYPIFPIDVITVPLGQRKIFSFLSQAASCAMYNYKEGRHHSHNRLRDQP